MRKTVVVFLAAVVLVAVAAVAYADSIPDKISRQEARIGQGITRGDLSRGEADILTRNLNYIKDRYYRMISDGTMTQGERHRLSRMLEDNNQMIYRKRHNAVRQLY